MTVFDVLSALMLSTCGENKGSVMTTKQTPLLSENPNHVNVVFRTGLQVK